MLKDASAFSGFSVDDIDEAKAFYGETLGLNVESQGDMGFKIKLATGGVVFVYPKGASHEPASFTILNFPVENIDEAMSELQAKGVEFINYDNPQMPQDEKGVLRGLKVKMGPDIAWFKDPAGNVLSILQDK